MVPEPPTWTRARVARPTSDLRAARLFYGDLVGLPVVGGFDGHAGYDGIFFGLPGGVQLELTAGGPAPVPQTGDDLLVLYVATANDIATFVERARRARVPRVASENPYWDECGATFLDPDGYRLVIAHVDTSVDRLRVRRERPLSARP